jgi:proteasome lid subunit RPN8/RPN11
MGMDIEVTSAVIATLVAEAARIAPAECCGLLLGRGIRIFAVRPAANVADEPLTRFEIDPAALISAHREARAGGAELIGYYHSHPTGHPRPSATDCEHASGDERPWAIIAAGQVAFWRDGKDGFEALSHCVVDG